MIDIPNQLAAIHREVGDDGKAVGVLLRRSYAAAIEDVWDAVTDPDRMKRWFLPVSGDLRIGGTFQLEATPGAWTAVVESSGTATSNELAAATEVSLAQFAPDVD